MTRTLAALLLLAATPPSSAPAGRTYVSHLMVDQQVTVSSRITGVIAKVEVDRGAVVSRGQPLATLELEEFDQDVKQAREQMGLARAQLDRSEALSSSGVSSKEDLDEKRAQYAVAVAAWEKAKAIRDYAVIRAPFDGVISEKYARVGEKVIDIQNVPLFQVTAFEPLLARIYVPEQDLLMLRRGQPVEVVPVHFPKARTTGVIEFISPTIDAASGTFQIIVRVQRRPAPTILRPGLAVEVRLPGGASP